MSASNERFFRTSFISYIRFLCVASTIVLIIWMGRSAFIRYQRLSDKSNIARLNEKVSLYKQEVGAMPDLNLIELYHKGLTQQRLHRTPFGGYYRLHPNQSVVYNPNVADR